MGRKGIRFKSNEPQDTRKPEITVKYQQSQKV